MTWYEFKRTFTQKQEDALWQYFMDHSKLQPNGYWGIMFYIQDVDDFWRRVHARYMGDFARYDVLEKEKMRNTRMGKAMNRRVKWIEKHGSWKQKLMVYLYRTSREYLQRMGDPAKLEDLHPSG